MPESKNETSNAAPATKAITAAEAAKLVKGTVRVPKTDQGGKPVVIAEGPAKGQYQIVERPITEADILSAAERGDQVVVVTVDGQKLTAAKPKR